MLCIGVLLSIGCDAGQNGDDGALSDLDFAVGTWKTSGTQYWGDGTWVSHKGIVEAFLSDDRRTLVRVFWAAFENGASLGGKSIHTLDPTTGQWSGRWVPTAGQWNATPALGEFKDDEYHEVATGSDGAGAFTSFTRFFDISEEGYSVVSDLHYDSGTISEGNWQIRFDRIAEEPLSGDSQNPQDMNFMVGEWDAEGTLRLNDGSIATHRSFVEATVAQDGNGVERHFWGAISVGGALRGFNLHRPSDDNASVWISSWTPVGASGPVSTTTGQFAGGEFIDTQDDGNGQSVTRFFDITSTRYTVQTDVQQTNGRTTEGVWTVEFRRIQ